MFVSRVWVLNEPRMLNQEDAFSQRKRSVSKQLPGAWLMHIQMSCLIIKTVNLAVITAVALAPGVFWLEDELQSGRNAQTLKSLPHILASKAAKNCIHINCEYNYSILWKKRPAAGTSSSWYKTRCNHFQCVSSLMELQHPHEVASQLFHLRKKTDLTQIKVL